MDNRGHDSETSVNETKQRPRRPRRKRNPQNTHDYRDGGAVADAERNTIANDVALSLSRTSLDNPLDGNPTLNQSRSEKRRNHANRRLTKMSNTSAEVETKDRSRPRRKARSNQQISRSVSEEVLSAEKPVEVVPAEVPRVKKTSRQSDRVDGHPRKSRTSEQPRKRRPRGNYASDTEDNYQGDAEFSEFAFPVDSEDVITSPDVSSKTTASRAQMVPLPSTNTNQVYVEKRGGGGFVNENRSKKTVTPTRPPPYDFNTKGQNTLEFVLKLQLRFRTFSCVVQGVMAGIAISQCIFVFSLSKESDTTLLRNYARLALTYQSMYYFLLAICNVAIFDRYVNLSSGWGQFCSTLCRRPSRGVALVSYVLALLFSVSMAHLDERLSLYHVDTDLWTKNVGRHLVTWKAVNVCRAVGSVLGWITVALAPTDDETVFFIEDKINKERGGDGLGISNGRYSTSIVLMDQV